MRRLGGVLFAAFALGIGGLALALDPARAVRPEAALRLLTAGATTLGWCGAALGAGAALVRRLAPALLEDSRGLLYAGLAGLLLWGFGALGLAAAGLLATPGLAALAGALAAGWLSRPRLVWPRPGAALVVAAAAALSPGLLDALAPPIDTDELYYHLALPAEMLRQGGLVGGLLRPDGNRPMALHLPYAALMAWGGDSAPRMLHLLLGGGALAATLALGRTWLGRGAGEIAALALLGSWTFSAELGLASNNLPAALAVLVALDAGLRGSRGGLALASGAALAIKYTVAGPLVGVFLAARLPWRDRVLAGLAALALVSPWWLRNAATGVHPLFPFAGWPALGDVSFAFQYLDKYGAGRDATAMLTLPWNAVMTARTDTFRFLGRLNPVFLALVPGLIAAAIRPGHARRVLGAASVAALAWAAGPHWLRYLLPGLPLLALAGAAAFADGGPLSGRLPRAALLVCGLAGLPANLGPALVRAAERWPAATGQQEREAYLASKLEDWPVVAYVNQQLPRDARVALLFNWDNALIERATLLGSVEDHVPSRYFLVQHGDQALSALVEAGATHLVVSQVNFLARLYPFLSESEFQKQFIAPEAGLDALLLKHATLVFQQGRSRVYRLERSTSHKDP